MLQSGAGALGLAAIIVGSGAMMGYLLMRLGRKRGLVMVALGHVLAAIGLVVGLRQGQGMDPLVMQLFLILLVIPSLIGLGIGAAIGWWRGRA